MKIGFDVSQTCGPRAGCAWYADSIVRAMAPLSPGDHFFLYHQFGTSINESTEGGTTIAAPNVTPTFTDVTPAEAARIWGSPSELIIKTGAPDIVHANSFRAPRVPGARLVFTVYDVSFWAVPQFTTEENRLVCQHGVLEALAHADGFLFISQSAREEFERMLPGWLDEARRPWTVTPLGPRHPTPATPDDAAPADYWLAVGSLEPRKNYETLLDALEIYWEKSAARRPLKIAGGPGWKSEDLRQRIGALARRGLLSHLGYVPDPDLPALYRGAAALVFPSWYEGFGLPVLEAMTNGCPVICSTWASLREVAGDAAVYCEAGDPRQIAAAMLRLECEPGLRETSRQRGRQQAAGFSWEQTARDTLAFYAKIVGK